AFRSDAGDCIHHLDWGRRNTRLADCSVDRIAVFPLRIIWILFPFPRSARHVSFVFVWKINARSLADTKLLLPFLQIVDTEFQTAAIEETVARDLNGALNIRRAVIAETMRKTAAYLDASAAG